MDPNVLFDRIFTALHEESHRLQSSLRQMHCEEDKKALGDGWVKFNQFLEDYFKDIIEPGYPSPTNSQLSAFKRWSWHRWFWLWLLPLCVRLLLWWWVLRYAKNRWKHHRRWQQVQKTVKAFCIEESSSLYEAPHTSSLLSLSLPFRERKMKKKTMEDKTLVWRSSSFFFFRLCAGWGFLVLALLCFISVLFVYPLMGQSVDLLLSMLHVPLSWRSMAENLLFFPFADSTASTGDGGQAFMDGTTSLTSSILRWLPAMHWYYTFVQVAHQHFSMSVMAKYLCFIVPAFIGLIFAAVFQASALLDAITSYGYDHTALIVEDRIREEEEILAGAGAVAFAHLHAREKALLERENQKRRRRVKQGKQKGVKGIGGSREGE